MHQMPDSDYDIVCFVLRVQRYCFSSDYKVHFNFIYLTNTHFRDQNVRP